MKMTLNIRFLDSIYRQQCAHCASSGYWTVPSQCNIFSSVNKTLKTYKNAFWTFVNWFRTIEDKHSYLNKCFDCLPLKVTTDFKDMYRGWTEQPLVNAALPPEPQPTLATPFGTSNLFYIILFVHSLLLLFNCFYCCYSFSLMSFYCFLSFVLCDVDLLLLLLLLS